MPGGRSRRRRPIPILIADQPDLLLVCVGFRLLVPSAPTRAPYAATRHALAARASCSPAPNILGRNVDTLLAFPSKRVPGPCASPKTQTRCKGSGSLCPIRTTSSTSAERAVDCLAADITNIAFNDGRCAVELPSFRGEADGRGREPVLRDAHFLSTRTSP